MLGMRVVNVGNGLVISCMPTPRAGWCTLLVGRLMLDKGKFISLRNELLPVRGFHPTHNNLMGCNVVRFYY